MPRTPRRARSAIQIEILEARTLLSGGLATFSGPWMPPKADAPASTVLLRFTAGTSASLAQADLDTVGGRVVTSYPDGPSVVALPPGESSQAAIRALSAEPGVSYADADASIHATGIVIPNDTGYPQQWGLATIDAPFAWGITTGSASTIVAVLDTGIDLQSPDLVSKLWTEPGNPSIHGWNFVNNNNNIQDTNSHGSHVSGILAAATNNGVGVAGVDWNAQIMPLKVLDGNGNGSTGAAVSAIYFAVQNGAKVINASWGGGEYSQAMIDAINFAGTHGVVFVTAAGNESANNDSITTYPASYRLPNELVVAAVDQNGSLANFSNYGAKTVDLAAPGVNILSTVPGGYANDTGTSMSTPFVSGTVALLAGLEPNLSATQLVHQVLATVKPDPALAGLTVTGGVVDAYFALTDHIATGGGVGATGTNQGPTISEQAVEAEMLSSDAFYQQHGNTNTGFITGVYFALVGRAPTSTDLAWWTGQLQGRLSRTAVITNLQNSSEAQITRVARIYLDEIGTTESLAQLKVDPALAPFGSVFSSGATVAAIQSGLLSSADYYQNLGGTDVAYITGLYSALVNRAPTSADLAWWTGRLQAGLSRSQLVEFLLSSTEGHRITVARIFQDEMGNTQSLATLENNAGVAAFANQLGQD